MYYKHSGHVSFDGLLVGVGMGIVSGFALAISYAYGIIAVPYDQLAIIVTCAFGGLLGAATGFGFVLGQGSEPDCRGCSHFGDLRERTLPELGLLGFCDPRQSAS
jgi:hypothetical protein